MNKIKLTYLHGRILCFDSSDYFKIRYEHRIIGSLIGPGINYPSNRDYKSLPAVFTDYEAQLMIEKGIAVVVEKPQLIKEPDDETQKQFAIEYERQSKDLKEFEVEEGMKVFKSNIESVYKGQVKKMERNKKKGEVEEIRIKTIEELIEEHEAKLRQSPCQHRLVHIPTKNPCATEETFRTIIPQNPFKYKVFLDLWEKGYTLTCGETFSGDFLCYPGDPLHYHATYIIIICESDTELDEKTILMHGRTAVGVKKGCIFAQKTEDDAIRYKTLYWMGPEEPSKEIPMEIENS